MTQTVADVETSAQTQL
ncbi:hypothetical protein RRG08_013600, partial [Elysia crispata]